MSQVTFEQALQMAAAHYYAGRSAEAESICRQVLAAQPGHPIGLALLGIIAHQTRRLELAAECFHRQTLVQPGDAQAHSNLAETYRSLGRFDEALASCQRAVALRPDSFEALNNLGTIFKSMERDDEARACYERALAVCPDYAEAHKNLGWLQHSRGRFEEAIAFYERALASAPRHAGVLNNLGNVYRETYRFEEAIACYQRALECQPELSEVYSNLGSALKDVGRLSEALACFRRALALNPQDAGLHSNLILTLRYDPAAGADVIREEERRWNERHAGPWRAPLRPHANGRDPARRLKVGYVSADFCAHAVSLFILPLLQAHDRVQVESHCYSSTLRPDATTARIRQSADVWHVVSASTDEALAEQIRADGIDILVDLGLHTADNRLPVFARRPAPVQISWLGYAGSAGLDAIPYRLSDACLEPSGAGVLPLETGVWCCYDPLDETPPVAPLPALGREDRAVTFGSLNNFCKINAAVLAVWARILAAVPGSRLLLFCPETGGARERVRAMLDPARVEFIGRQTGDEYRRTHHRIDVGLDPWPFNGMTTTCEALWMGVPVVTLAGEMAHGRTGRGRRGWRGT